MPEMDWKLHTCSGGRISKIHNVQGKRRPQKEYAYSLVLDGRTIRAQYELLRCCCEVGKAGNRQVLVIQIGVSLYLLVGLPVLLALRGLRWWKS